MNDIELFFIGLFVIICIILFVGLCYDIVKYVKTKEGCILVLGLFGSLYWMIMFIGYLVTPEYLCLYFVIKILTMMIFLL